MFIWRPYFSSIMRLFYQKYHLNILINIFSVLLNKLNDGVGIILVDINLIVELLFVRPKLKEWGHVFDRRCRRTGYWHRVPPCWNYYHHIQGYYHLIDFWLCILANKCCIMILIRLFIVQISYIVNTTPLSDIIGWFLELVHTTQVLHLMGWTFHYDCPIRSLDKILSFDIWSISAIVKFSRFF